MNSHTLQRVYLIRHCKSYGQEPDAKLTEEGVEQAHALADFLVKSEIGHIVSSPYERAIASIKPLAQQLNLTIHTDERLRERVLSTESLQDWEQNLCETFEDNDLRLPGGETSSEAMARGILVIEELRKASAKCLAVVTHGNLMCLMLRHYHKRYGFMEWKNLTNPDIFELLISQESKSISVKRVWGDV